MTIDNFNPELYLAANKDLLSAFGDDVNEATRHYSEYGEKEGRTQNFDAESYLAANADLISALNGDATRALQHYLDYGYREGRVTTFDADSYLAANNDVLAAFGRDETAATEHYVKYGYKEGRATDFNAKEYLAANKDLLNTFGENTDAALEHYLEHGYHEGRQTNFNVSKYLQANADVESAYGDDLEGALEHYLNHGYLEGRETELHETGAVSTTETSTGTTTAVGATTVFTGTSASESYVATGSVQFQGNGGGDTVKLVERGGADKIVFAAASDGTAAGVGTGYDVIKNFQPGVDKIVISGALLALVDHNGDGALASVSRGRNGIVGSTDELVRFTAGMDDLNDDGVLKVAAQFGTAQGTGDVLLIAGEEDKSALYLMHTSGGAVGTSDLRLLGVFKDSRVTLGDFTVG